MRRRAKLVRQLRGRLGLMWLMVGLLSVVALTGLARLRFDDELVRFFDSDIAAFEEYAALGQAFEGDGNDVIALVEGRDLAAPQVAEALSDFVLDAQFVPGVRAVISPLSLRLDDGPLFGFPPLARDTMAERLAQARTALPLLARLMAEDRSAMLMLIPITEHDENAQAERSAILHALAGLAGRAEARAELTIRLSGYPVLRDEVARALMRDIVLLLAIGVALGLGVAMIALRSVRLGLLTLPGPALAVALGVGLHGHLGISINAITITLPVLILVLATADAIHISFERGRQGGRDSAHATLRAVRRVAVACVFAAVTTAVAFAALAVSPSQIIAEMGRMGALVTLVSVAVVLLTQTAVLTTAGRAAWFNRLFDRLHARPPGARWAGALPGLALARPRLVTAISLVLLAASALAYAEAGPRYSLLDALRASSPTRATFEAIERKVTPVSQMHIVVNSTEPQLVARVAEVVTAAMQAPPVQTLADVEGGAAELGARLPAPLAGRLLSRDGTAALISVPYVYENGKQTLVLAEKIEAALASAAGIAPDDVGPVTGLGVMSARVAGEILGQIKRGLLIALGGVALLIWVWLRSLRVALIALIPNMLPVTLIGGWLMLSGSGIAFSNGLALTIAFGIAVDDTLHVLNRLRLAGGVHRVTRAGLVTAFAEVSPALVTTSVVLFLGTSGTILAENLGVAEFGVIAMAVFVLALVADLLVLPAALATLGPRSYLRHGSLA